MKIPDRILENAKQLNRDYSHANKLLSDAVREAMPWAGPLAMNGVIPSADRLERLATQLIAILMATYPDDFSTPVKGYGDR